MKNCLLTGTVAILTCFSLVAYAQDGGKPAAAKPAAAKADAKSDARAETKKGRLPSNYGKLGLTDAQKTKIYGVQGSYEDQLDALEKQTMALKSKRDSEIEAILTPEQKKILQALVDSKDDKKDKAEPAKEAKK